MPIPVQAKRNSGPAGLAEVRVLADSLRVIFKKDDDTYQVEKNGWGDRPSGLYNVTLTRARDSIKWLSPPGRDEPYLVKFAEFSNRVGKTDTDPGIPEAKMKPGETKFWPSGGSSYIPEHPVTMAKMVIVEKGPYAGLTIPYELPYIFTQYPGNTSIAMLNGTAAQNRRVEEFLRVAGPDFAVMDIPYSHNVLPWIEETLQQLNVRFSVQLNDRGFVAKDGIRAIPSYLLPPEEDEEVEAKPKKKAARKPRAKAKK